VRTFAPAQKQSQNEIAAARSPTAASRGGTSHAAQTLQPVGNQAMQRRLRNAQPEVPSDGSARAADTAAMPGPLRATMERTLGADFSDVRIRNPSARASELNAAAFTQGSEIHVAPGHWAPHTSKGRELLGHELGHVLQQRAGRVRTTATLASAPLNDDPGLEREADAIGARASAAHAPAAALPPTAASTPGGVIQRQTLTPQPGSPVDRVMDALSVVNPVAGVGDFPAAFKVLDGVATVDELLAVLSDLEALSQLDLLIANAGSVAAPNRVRMETAMQVVRQSRGATANMAAALATIAASGLPADVQQALSNFARVPASHGADLRGAISPGGAAAVPNSALGTDIGYELDPGSRPLPATPAPPPAGPAAPAPAPAAPPRIPWDGATGAPAATAARGKMQAELFKAFDAYLKHFRPTVVASLAQKHVSFNAPAAAAGAAGPAPTGVVDIANQSRAVLEARYATSMNAAAPSAALTAGRAARTSAPGAQNIVDASSEADRSAMTHSPDLAPAVAWWLFQNDTPGASDAAGSRRFATDILAAHHFSTDDPGAEDFQLAVAKAYAAVPANTRQLIDYRMTQWSESDSAGRKITLLSGFDPGADASKAELTERWEIFSAATHEGLHLRTHPAFEAAQQGRDSMMEGFTEMFTVATLNTDVLPRVRAGSMEPLRRTVEGALSPTPIDKALITDVVTPTQYAEHRAEAERIRDGGTPTGGTAHAGVGEAAVRAAYFEGHVEYIGLAPAGSQLTGLPAPGKSPLAPIPKGLKGLDELARRSGVPRAAIERDNPGITDALPASAVLSGCREHRVVAGETRANIAAQNGVSEADLVRANPDIALDPATSDWAAPAPGTRILIPVH
jgi:hypothetical protein